MSIKVVEMTAMRTYPPKKVLDVSLLKLEAKLAVHSLTESELAWLIVSCPLLQQYLRQLCMFPISRVVIH